MLVIQRNINYRESNIGGQSWEISVNHLKFQKSLVSVFSISYNNYLIEELIHGSRSTQQRLPLFTAGVKKT